MNLPKLYPLLALMACAPAVSDAHVVFSTASLPSGGKYQVTSLRISHGCKGSATVSLRLEIPEGVTGKPEAKAGWTISYEHKPLPQPLVVEGVTITDRVSAITWTGRLPDDQFDEFELMFNLPKQTGPLYFPAQQVCETGRRDWIEIPVQGQDRHGLSSPAAVLTLTDTNQAEPDHAGHHGQ